MKKILWIPIVGVMLVVAFFIGQAISIASGVASTATATISAVAPPEEKIEVSRQAMLRALDGKLEITTASMRLEKYVHGGICTGNAWQQFAYENCVTMLVPAKINAGFDWESFGPDNIEVTHEVITIKLGTPKIHDVVIDHSGIKVLDQSDGALVFSDTSLQTRILAESTPAFRKDACFNGILKTAALVAEKKVGDNIRLILRQAGDVRQVKITYTMPAC